MNDILKIPTYTGALIDEFALPRWSQLASGEFTKVPQSIQEHMKEKAAYYADKEWAYKDKDYSSPKSTQIEINSKSDEAYILQLLNTNNQAFKTKLLNLLAQAAANKIFIPGRYNPITELSTYKFNGENQDIPHHKAGTFDLVRTDREYRAVYSIEVKTSIFENRPSELHRAELVLLHILGKDKVIAFISPERWEDRKEANYIKIGEITEISGWKNVRVDSNWNITLWQ